MQPTNRRRVDPRLFAQEAHDQHAGRPGRSHFLASTESARADTRPAVSDTHACLVQVRAGSGADSFRHLNPRHIIGDFYSVDAPTDALVALGEDTSVEYVEKGTPMSIDMITSVPETRADRVRRGGPSAQGLDGTGVVVGIIDFGFDYTLDDFRNADGTTRLAFLWDQDLSPITGETSPTDFGHGVEYDRAAIDAALGQADPFDHVRHRPDPSSHGTHVAGTACGNGRSGDAAFPAGHYPGVATNATIVFVQPRTEQSAETFTDSIRVVEAITYIFRKADALGLPCVINMSLGQNGGSHDGESNVERAIDRLLERTGRAFVVAAGNEHIWREHAAGVIQDGGSRTLRWKVGGGLQLPGGGSLPPGAGDFTSNSMEIWHSSRDSLRVRLTSPAGDRTNWVDPDAADFLTTSAGTSVFVQSTRFTVLNGDSRVYLDMRPATGSTIETGVWEVEIEGMAIADGRIDAWIERDARRQNNNFADQSFFLGADYEPTRTLGTPATGRRSIAVANYNHQTETPNDSSGRGPTRDSRHKPEVSAPGTNIMSSNAMGGRQAPDGSTYPMRVSKSGTSMAAPHVAGIVAQLLQHDGNLSAVQLRSILIASARPPTGVTVFDEAWGFGKVDAEAAVALIS